MVKRIHTIKINLPGGIVTAGQLYDILCAAGEARVASARLGKRQQLYFRVSSDYLQDFTKRLEELSTAYELDESRFPNITSSYVTEEVFNNGNWLSESVYRDILDLFDYQPQLKVNIVDNSQTFVPLFTGHINFIASYTGNYWFLYVRFPKTHILFCWPALVYSADIPQLSKHIEAVIFENKPILPEQVIMNGDLLVSSVYKKQVFITYPINKPLTRPEFQLPYYEGFNTYGNKTWLGIHNREEIYAVDFLKDLCRICVKTRLGQVYTTPWKSLVIKNIQQPDRKYWNHLLGKYRINVRHASNELNWQIEDLNDEALTLKRFLVRAFDKDDVRTYGLSFAVKTQPQSKLFGSVVIEKLANNTATKLKSLDRYSIFYTKDFDPNSNEYILFRKDIEKENLESYLVSLCKYFYETQSNEQVDHSIYQAEIKPAQALAVIEAAGVHQCTRCFTIYDPEYGDSLNDIPSGTAFTDIENYECSTCGAGKADFVIVPKPVFKET